MLIFFTIHILWGVNENIYIFLNCNLCAGISLQTVLMLIN